MKTIRTIFSLALICIATFSNAQFIAHCTIYNEEDVKFTVYLNGEKKNDEPKSNVRIINLTQAYFKAKFVFEDPTIPPIEKGLFQVQDAQGAPCDVTFIMKKNKKGEWGVHWRSQTTYPGYIETNKPTVIVIPAGNGVTQTTTTTQVQEESGTRVSFGTPGGSVSFNTGGSSATPATTQTTTTVVSSGGGTAVASPCAGGVLGEDDFNSALRSINARSTDEGKLLSAKQIISSNCITTAHVKKIMQIFADENQKLEVAKYAYDFTADKGNYFKLNDEFKNEANIEALYKTITK